MTALNPARARHLPGTTAGGRFAPQPHSESELSLSGPPEPARLRPNRRDRTAADWFDAPAPTGAEPGLDLAPRPSTDPAAALIAARIRAGHTLVMARRARAAHPDLDETKEMLARAEQTVQDARDRIAAHESGSADQP